MVQAGKGRGLCIQRDTINFFLANKTLSRKKKKKKDREHTEPDQDTNSKKSINKITTKHKEKMFKIRKGGERKITD